MTLSILRRDEFDVFFDRLTLFCLTQCHDRSNEDIRVHFKAESVPRTTWQTFLDEICNLCHFKQGGEGVVALGVQARFPEPVFWVSTNAATSLDGVVRHMDRIVRLLRGITNVQQHRSIAEAIFRMSVSRARRRVHNYWKRLSALVGDLSIGTSDSNRLATPGSASVTEIRDALNKMLELPRNLKSRRRALARCKAAANFKASSSYQTLLACNGGDAAETSFRICHYIGRLTAWERSANFVTSHAAHFEAVLRTAIVLPVMPPSPSRRSIQVMTDVEMLLRRVLQLEDRRQLRTLASSLRTNGRNLLEKWARKTTQQVPCVHAEINVAHHFYFHHLESTYADRYIGCSKPPCYCCQLLLDEHPGQFRMRHTSNNAWLQWSPGIPFIGSEGGRADSGVAGDDRLVAAVQRVSERLLQDIVEVVSRQQTLRGSKFDSTNGETLSVLVRR